MIELSQFEKYAKRVNGKHEFVAVCRATHGEEQLFHIVFDTLEHLLDFMGRNDGDCNEIGFYATAYRQGEFVGENT